MHLGSFWKVGHFREDLLSLEIVSDGVPVPELQNSGPKNSNFKLGVVSVL
ncbi:hypothetical protein EXN66_Car005086 [Channa argus]|uniref:Uncharacterized protein n=1 Tax=Channa argus TaxID=215402 RepID=A0A6G1PGZ3_CHAAH|nr:hypothetical protein EXN66_Car005086 [Channa argus]